MRQIVLGLGSNIDRAKNIRLAVKTLRTLFGELFVSSIYKTQAVGFNGPDFYNLVVVIHTNLSLDELVTQLREIETRAGRIRKKNNLQSRCLDIDVLLFGQQNLRAQGRNIPREEISHAAYVLKPLAEVLPKALHPITQISFSDMWQGFKCPFSCKPHKISLSL